tara:strand:- start:63743 stop:64204 length:462 start_codon:yes stop_codon:yes gene_type:complete
MNKLILLILITFQIVLCFGQSKSIIIEVGGNAGLGSINFENIFKTKETSRLFFRAGISGTPLDQNTGFLLILPITFGGFIGNTEHFFEWGAGLSPSLTTKGGFFARGVINCGYRWENKSKPFFLGLKYAPLISFIVDFQYQHWAGITIGYKLK